MAGLRMGYAIGHPDTIKKMADWDGGSGTGSLNVLAMQAGDRGDSAGRRRSSPPSARATRPCATSR